MSLSSSYKTRTWFISWGDTEAQRIVLLPYSKRGPCIVIPVGPRAKNTLVSSHSPGKGRLETLNFPKVWECESEWCFCVLQWTSSLSRVYSLPSLYVPELAGQADPPRDTIKWMEDTGEIDGWMNLTQTYIKSWPDAVVGLWKMSKTEFRFCSLWCAIMSMKWGEVAKIWE